MQKGRARFLLLCLTFVFLFGFGGEVGAFDFFDQRLRIHGNVRNETGMRLKDHVWYDLMTINTPGIDPVENARQEEYKLSTCRTTLQLEGEFDVTRDIIATVVLRAHYDAKYDLDSTIWNAEDEYPSYRDYPKNMGEPHGEDYQYDAEVREYWFKWLVGDFMIKVGRQQIAWGEADAIRIADIVNPLDYSRDFTTTCYGLDWEDIRVPTRSIDVLYTVPDSEYQFEVELVVVPENFKTNIKGMPYGENFFMFPQMVNFSYWDPNQILLSGSPAVGGATSVDMYTAFTNAMWKGYREAVGSWSGGGRLRGVFGGWDLHLFYFHQRWQDPVISAPYYIHAVLPQAIDRDDWGLKMEFPRIDTVGATMNYFWAPLGMVLRGECGYVFDEPFEGLRQGTFPTAGFGQQQWSGWFADEIETRDTFHYMLGFDRPTWITFLNASSTFFVSWQFYHKMIFDYNDTVPSWKKKGILLNTMMGRDSSADHKTLTSLKINTMYFDDTIRPDILCVWDINAASGFVLPKLTWAPAYEWEIQIGCLYWWSDNWLSGPFGYVSHNDLVYGMIEYKF